MLVEEPLFKYVSYPWDFMLLGQHIAYWSIAAHLESCCLSVGFYFSMCKLNLYSTHGSSPQNEEEK